MTTQTQETHAEFTKKLNAHIRRVAIKTAHEVAQDAVERARSVLREVERYARNIEEAQSPSDKAERLDWMINYTTQRLFDVPQMTGALVKLVGAAANENE